MVFNRQSKTGKLGQKNTIYIVCDNCNRKEDKIRKYFTRSPMETLPRTVWEKPWVAALPSASPKLSSVKFLWVSSVKYLMNLVLFPVAQSHMAKYTFCSLLYTLYRGSGSVD